MEYRGIEGFEDYEVGDDGSVWSLRFDGRKRLRPAYTSTGYLQVVLRKDHKNHSRIVHKLVLTAFVGDRPEGMEARHLDSDKTNNALSNLSWGTRAENLSDKPKKYKPLGPQGARMVRQLHSEGHNMPQISRIMDQSIINVRNAIKLRTYKDQGFDANQKPPRNEGS